MAEGAFTAISSITRPTGLGKILVQRVHPVQRPEVGGAGLRAFVQVILLGGGAVQPHMTVGINEAGEDMAPPGVDKAVGPGVPGQVGHGAYPGDEAVCRLHEAVGDGPRVHGVDDAVDNQHQKFLLCQGSTFFHRRVWYTLSAASHLRQSRGMGVPPCGHSILPRK